MSTTIGLQIFLRDGRSIDAVHDSDSILIGSGPSAVLRLDDPNVSSIHAVVKVSPDGHVTIIDLGSEAGTTVNGYAVSEPVTLKVGDQIGVGGARIVIAQLGAPKAHVLADSDVTAPTTQRPQSKQQPIPQFPEPKTVAAPPAPLQPKYTPPKPQPVQQVQHMSHAHHSEKKGSGPASMGPEQAGRHIVRRDEAIDPSLLNKPLNPNHKPTDQEKVLEVVVLWGDTVVDSCQVAEPRAVTVGPRRGEGKFAFVMGATKKTDLEVEGEGDVFVIAYNRGGEAEIAVPSGASVAMRRGDGPVQRDLPGGRIGLHDRAAVKIGTLTYLVQFTRGNAEMGKGAVMDWYFPRVFTISALAHIFFMVAAFITPNNESSLIDEMFKNQNRFAQMILKAPEKEKKRKKLDLSGMKGGGKHKGEEGKFGKKDIPKKDALASKAGAPRVDPNKREKDRKIAMNAGLLGILKGSAGSGAVSNVFGPGGLGTGINNAMGGLRGSEMGDAGGAGGLGTRGTGAGGGGNSLGIGGLGTHGGRGTGGYGNIDLGGRGKGTTRIVPGRTIIQGSLTKEEIGRVIRRNLARFKYCYEKQLNANPNLAGKISVYFTIAPTGAVASASVRETSMNDQNVESCALTVMRSLKFPKPRGGGIVVVTYPFVFAST